MSALGLINVVLLGLFVWACVWSHLAFTRYEEREDAKLRALQQIAKKLEDGKAREGDDMRATR